MLSYRIRLERISQERKIHGTLGENSVGAQCSLWNPHIMAGDDAIISHLSRENFPGDKLLTKSLVGHLQKFPSVYYALNTGDRCLLHLLSQGVRVQKGQVARGDNRFVDNRVSQESCNL
jgi:hypothetical protein